MDSVAQKGSLAYSITVNYYSTAEDEPTTCSAPWARRTFPPGSERFSPEKTPARKNFPPRVFFWPIRR